MNEHIVIITGAQSLADDVVDRIGDTSILLAVDGGLDHALAAGLRPSGLIGDLDSVTADGLAWATEHATISRHPSDKDRTDTELALSFAAAMNPSGITLIGGGDRLDHTMSAIGALGALDLTGVPEIDAWWDGQHIDIVHGPGAAELHLEIGSTLSLLALHGSCDKVSINGVRWPLDRVELEPMIGWGISNEVVDDPVHIELTNGIVTVFDAPDDSPPDDSPPDREGDHT